MDEKDFEADSWSLAVDSSFLQQQKKEVMKKQDVIYGTPRALWSPRPFLTRPRLLASSPCHLPVGHPHLILGLHVPRGHQLVPVHLLLGAIGIFFIFYLIDKGLTM